MKPCRVGIGRAELTPSGSGWPAGYSALGRRVGPQQPHEPPLTVTALALVDGRGRRLLLLHADLHSAGRALWREVVRGLPGWSPREVVLSATHTHLGPGNIYGSPLFDAMTAARPWPLSTGVTPVAQAVLRAAHQAIGGLTEGGVCWLRPSVVGLTSNRSLAAFRRNPDGLQRAFASGPAADLQALEHAADRAVDPRLSLLAVGPVGGAPIAALGWFACHGTSLGPEWPRWSAEWAGYARQAAEAPGDLLLGLASGCTGDVSPLPLSETGEPRTNETERAHQAGRAAATRIGARVAQIARRALAGAELSPYSLDVAHTEWAPARGGHSARYGLATLGGAIDGPHPEHFERFGTGIHAPGYASDRAFPEGHPQHPKVDAAHGLGMGLLPLGAAIGWLAPRQLPLHTARIGDGLLLTVPGEPTTLAGYTLERSVANLAGVSRCVVAGYSGTYAGYWCTPEEYDLQRYEGASALFGREALPQLEAHLNGLARSLSSAHAIRPSGALTANILGKDQ